MEHLQAVIRTLNNNTGLLMVLLTFVYVLYTIKILRQVREQTWLANRAYIVLRLVFRGKILLALELANEGKSPAEDLKLALDRDLYQNGEVSKRINDMPMFSETFATVPPGGKYHVFLWSGTVVLGTDLFPTEFKITATYRSLARAITEETTLHPLLYAEFPALAIEESLEKLPGILEEMKKTLEKIVFRFDQYFRYGK